MSDFYDLTWKGKTLERMASDWWNRAPKWNVDLAIPAFLLKDCDRDEDSPDQYGRGDE